MPAIEIRDGKLMVHRFGDLVQIAVPEGGRIEICTEKTHTDVEVRSPTGVVSRRFRLPKEVDHGPPA